MSVEPLRPRAWSGVLEVRKASPFLENGRRSDMIKDMRNVPWALAIMVIVAMVVIAAVALTDRDVAAVSAAITTLLIALGLAELREIKSNTNGSNSTLMEQNRALMEELAEYRRGAAKMTERAFESAPLVPLLPPPTNGDKDNE